MSERATLAVIGCGRIANNAHFPALSNIPGVYVKYACDLIPEKAQRMKDTYPELVGEVITDYHIALSDPEVEAVLVLTPNYAHYTVTMDALRAGKHVLCEKPVTVSYELSCEMAQEANRQNRILNIGVCNRYHESVVRLRAMNERGELGRVYHVYCSFRGFRNIPGLGGAFTTKSQSGGGVLIDWGVHFLDLILYVLGGAKIQSVSASTYSELAKDMRSYKYKSMWAEETADVENGTNDVDDLVTGFIRTDKGTVTLNGAWAQNIENVEMFVDFLGDKKGARLDYGAQYHLTDGDTLTTVTSDHFIDNMFRLEDEAFIRSFKTGVKNENNVDGVLETMKLLDALYKSAELGKEIRFD